MPNLNSLFSLWGIFINHLWFTADEIQSTIGVDQDLWCYAKDMDNGGRGSGTPITFYAWDFAGQVHYVPVIMLHCILYYMQEEYSAAHQCFVTENSLYVLCWRACDEQEGINELMDWLLTIKVVTLYQMVTYNNIILYDLLG